MDLERLQYRMNETFQDMMEEEGMEALTDEQMARWPLDPRARPYHMHANKHLLCVPDNHRRSLDYYGGFEYVGEDDRMQVGNWIVYSTNDERVAQVVEAMLDIEIQR